MNKNFAATGLISLALLISFSSQAKIYKWTDQNGNVHYSATPPMQKQLKIKATDIEDKIRAAAGKYRAPVNTSEDKVDTEIAATSSTTDDGKHELQGPDKKLMEYCKNQRSNLEQLKKNYRNVWIDVSGKKTNLTQKQRKEKVDYLANRIKEDCAEIDKPAQ